MESGVGRRIRIARVNAGIDSQAVFAKVIESSPSTVQRTEEGKRTPKRSELLLIEEKTGVPMWFLEGGWENYPGSKSAPGSGAGGPIDQLGKKALEDLDHSDRQDRDGEDDEPGTGTAGGA